MCIQINYQVYKERQLFKEINTLGGSCFQLKSYKHFCVYFQLKDYTKDNKKETIFDKVFKRSLSAFHKEMQATISVEKQVRLISYLLQCVHGEQIYIDQLFGGFFVEK